MRSETKLPVEHRQRGKAGIGGSPHYNKHTFLPRLAGFEPPLDDLGIGGLVPHLCSLAGTRDRNRRARDASGMADTFGPRLVAVLVQLAHFAGVRVLEV